MKKERGSLKAVLRTSGGHVPLSVRALWIVGAGGFTAIILSFTPYTHFLDDIKVSLQFVLAPIIWGLFAWAALKGHTQPIHPWIKLTLLAYVLLALVSTLSADFRWKAREELGFELCLMGAFVAVAGTASTMRRFRNIALLYFGVGCVTIAFGWVHFFGGFGAIRYWLYPKPPQGQSHLYTILSTLDAYRYMFSTILNRDFYAAYLVMIVPLTAAFFLDGRSLERRILFAFAAVAYCATIVLARSNDSFLGVIVMGIVFAALYYWTEGRFLPKRTRILVAVGALLVLAATLFLMRRQVAAVPDRFRAAMNSRMILWPGAWQIFFDPDQPAPTFIRRFLIGCGPGGYLPLFPEYRSPDYYLFEIAHVTTFSHSQPLDLLSEHGLLGFLAFYVFLGGVVWLLLRQILARTNARVNTYQIALLSAILGVSIQNLTSPNIRWTACGFNYWFLLGLSAAAIRLGMKSESRERLDRIWTLPPNTGRLIAGGLLAASVVFALFAIPFGISRFAAAKYHYDGQRKVNDLNSLVPQLNALGNSQAAAEVRVRLRTLADDAQADLARSIAWMPSFVSARYQIGTLATRQLALTANAEEIERICRRGKESFQWLVENVPDYAELDLHYGLLLQQCYIRQKDPRDRELAIRYLDRAARLTTDLQTHYYRATALREMGETNRLLDACRRILELARRPGPKKDNPAVVDMAFVTLATAALAENDLDALARLYGFRVERDPDNAKFFEQWIDVLRSLGRDLEALGPLEAWSRRDPSDPAPRRMAVRILLANGREAEASLQLEALKAIEAGATSRPILTDGGKQP